MYKLYISVVVTFTVLTDILKYKFCNTIHGGKNRMNKFDEPQKIVEMQRRIRTRISELNREREYLKNCIRNLHGRFMELHTDAVGKVLVYGS